MALIRGAFGGGQIKGSLSGVTFQGNPFGQLIRNRTVPVNPNSPGQVDTRVAMAYCSNWWSQTLTDAQRQGWSDYAATTPLPDKFGTSQIVSGRSMFMRTNVINFLASLSIESNAPTSPGIGPCSVPGIGVDITTGITLDALSIDPVGGGAFQISLSPPVGAANNFFKGPFRTGFLILDNADLPVVLRAPADLEVGQYYFARYRQLSVDRKVSNSVIQKIGPIVP